MMQMKNGGEVVDTTRRHPRTVREAFPGLYRESAIGITGPAVIRLRAPWWVRVLRRLDAWLLSMSGK